MKWSQSLRGVAAVVALAVASCGRSPPSTDAESGEPSENLSGRAAGAADSPSEAANAAADAAAAAPQQNSSSGPAASDEVSACLIQDGKRIGDNAIHAVGTEPFWAADVKGRCVTYSHPENQSGTRVWTQFSGSAEEGTWSGALEGQKFVMKTRAQAGCSDGMSDKRYPIEVTLMVGGEQRRGCAEPR